MLEDKDDKLQNNVGTEETLDNTEAINNSDAGTESKSAPDPDTVETDSENNTEELVEDQSTSIHSEAKDEEKSKESATPKTPEKVTSPEKKATSEKLVDDSANNEGMAESIEKKEEDVLEEIDESNAEDAEDSDNHQRHHIPMPDYHAMPMENLVGELQRLVRNEKVQAIKKHVDGIKYEFDQKFQEFLDEKKEDFINSGGNEIDFRYNSVTKRQFNEVYSDYREKRNSYYKNLEQGLKSNLAERLEIINELKALVNVEEDINTTYKNFKDLQERWKNAGPIPRANYNDVWRTYHHHIEIFYDFLHLNRELRDLDFKHNYEEKLKIVVRAEELVQMEDLNKAFQELQTLHKIWKEDIGPVGKEHREEIWDRFSNATKLLHQRRQDYYKDLEKVYEQNLERKNEIISSISSIATHIASSHKELQQQIREIEKLRDAFFKAGKVPQKVNEKTWSNFKGAVREFNRNKNNYYKNLKKDQQLNLDKKRALLELAVSLKDSEEWDTTTEEMKRIQNEWKKIGHVPRKYSDKIWKEFKNACNHYFDRLHALKNEAQKEEIENFDRKNACLENLKNFQLSGDKGKDLAAIKGFISEWKEAGRVPFNKKSINAKFNKILDALFKKLDINRQEAELMKYGNKIQQLANNDNDYAISNERTFIRRKIDESKNEIRQLENNLQFFSNASEDNPLVKEVIKNIDNHKDSLATWKAKLKKLNILENNLMKEAEEAENEEDSISDEE
ncbi:MULTISPECIES: DUF349 domain-containing protein [unclassified Arenibacter]|uniref:DUF349 domain-containing protein n=1 Tax=unclassified Arenibacter TaxID=2615047 RepID=UPI000E356FED|nr:MULTISPECIES: DUF349 domain-containing protein [unclassified Arenibacter]MCM4165806.1 DUF349 domain-containing protein [Arenibacter sp. A80]RFT54653.1 DUF349 domain-containing protein [Arenibacter sp. P308M17]